MAQFTTSNRTPLSTPGLILIILFATFTLITYAIIMSLLQHRHLQSNSRILDEEAHMPGRVMPAQKSSAGTIVTAVHAVGRNCGNGEDLVDGYEEGEGGVVFKVVRYGTFEGEGEGGDGRYDGDDEDSME